MRRHETDNDDGQGPMIDVLFVLVLGLLLFVRQEAERLAIVQGEQTLDGQSDYDPVNGVNVEVKPDSLTLEGAAISEEELLRVIREQLARGDKQFVNYAVADDCVSGRALPLREKLCSEFGRKHIYEILNVQPQGEIK